MSSEQELRVKLKAVEEELETIREHVSVLNAVRRDTIRALHKELHGVEPGSIVTIDRALGKLKADEDLLVTEVDDRWFTDRRDQPTIRVRYKTKSGAWSNDTIAVYGSWKVKASE